MSREVRLEIGCLLVWDGRDILLTAGIQLSQILVLQFAGSRCRHIIFLTNRKYFRIVRCKY